MTKTPPKLRADAQRNRDKLLAAALSRCSPRRAPTCRWRRSPSGRRRHRHALPPLPHARGAAGGRLPQRGRPALGGGRRAAGRAPARRGARAVDGALPVATRSTKRGMRDALKAIVSSSELFADARRMNSRRSSACWPPAWPRGTLRPDVDAEDVLHAMGADLVAGRRRLGRARPPRARAGHGRPALPRLSHGAQLVQRVAHELPQVAGVVRLDPARERDAEDGDPGLRGEDRAPGRRRRGPAGRRPRPRRARRA